MTARILRLNLSHDFYDRTVSDVDLFISDSQEYLYSLGYRIITSDRDRATEDWANFDPNILDIGSAEVRDFDAFDLFNLEDDE